MESAYAFIPLPKGANWYANEIRELSPVNRLTNPPLFGKLEANSESVLAALADAVTASGSIPATESAYAFIPLPNGTNCNPNEAILLSPVNRLTNPPLFGILLASSANNFAALADAVTASGSIPDIDSA